MVSKNLIYTIRNNPTKIYLRRGAICPSVTILMHLEIYDARPASWLSDPLSCSWLSHHCTPDTSSWH